VGGVASLKQTLIFIFL